MPKIIPMFQARLLNETVQFTCNSTSARSWTFENKILSSNVEVSGEKHEILNIFNAEYKNSGTYKCITKDEGGREHILEGVLNIVNGMTHRYGFGLLNEIPSHKNAY